MPIEIRELIIKTEIISQKKSIPVIKEKELELLRNRILHDCKKLISENSRINTYKR